MTENNTQTQGRIIKGGGIFLAGQNIYPCITDRSSGIFSIKKNGRLFRETL